MEQIFLRGEQWGLPKVGLLKGCCWGWSNTEFQQLVQEMDAGNGDGRLYQAKAETPCHTSSCNRFCHTTVPIHMHTHMQRNSQWQWQCQHSSYIWRTWIAQNTGPNYQTTDQATSCLACRPHHITVGMILPRHSAHLDSKFQSRMRHWPHLIFTLSDVAIPLHKGTVLSRKTCMWNIYYTMPRNSDMMPGLAPQPSWSSGSSKGAWPEPKEGHNTIIIWACLLQYHQCRTEHQRLE